MKVTKTTILGNSKLGRETLVKAVRVVLSGGRMTLELRPN